MALVDGHPVAERLAEYADGLLEPAERNEVERHLATCADCRTVVAETMVFAQAEKPGAETLPRVVPFRGRRWVTVAGSALAVAAMIVLAIRLAKPEWVSGLFGPRGGRPELQELIAALEKEPTRPVEGRLTGGFKYAPAPAVTRGAPTRTVSPDVSIAAAKLEKAASSGESKALAASGVGALALGDVDSAIERLRAAAEREPVAASTLIDLSAAYITRSSMRGDVSDLESARQAADRALALEPMRPEALFNRALALSRLERFNEAEDTWRQYLAQERDPDWISEAVRLERALQAARERRP